MALVRRRLLLKRGTAAGLAVVVVALCALLLVVLVGDGLDQGHGVLRPHVVVPQVEPKQRPAPARLEGLGQVPRTLRTHLRRDRTR